MSKWLWKFADNGWADWICPECGFVENTDVHINLGYLYCPKCGTRLDSRDKVGTNKDIQLMCEAIKAYKVKAVFEARDILEEVIKDINDFEEHSLKFQNVDE